MVHRNHKLLWSIGVCFSLQKKKKKMQCVGRRISIILLFIAKVLYGSKFHLVHKINKFPCAYYLAIAYCL